MKWEAKRLQPSTSREMCQSSNGNINISHAAVRKMKNPTGCIKNVLKKYDKRCTIVKFEIKLIKKYFCIRNHIILNLH